MHASGSRGCGGSFALHAVSLFLFFAASSILTPLYVLYEKQWGHTSLISTVIFSAYALAILLSLLFLGALSDHYGRRPVILAAFFFETVALAIFLLATDPLWLIIGRLVQGFATGLAAASLGAALVDVDKEKGATANSVIPLAGLGGGALFSGVLADLVPGSLRLGFVVVLSLLCLQWIRTTGISSWPENVLAGRSEWRPRIQVPGKARKAFVAVGLINIALWSFAAFYLSLMPAVVRIWSPDTVWVSAAPAAGLTFSAAFAIYAASSWPTQKSLFIGIATLALGTALVALVYVIDKPYLFIPASIIAGFGFGACFLGCLRTLIPLAEPNERAGLLASIQVLSYVANGVPVLLAGYWAAHVQLHWLAIYFCLFVLTCLAAGSLMILRYGYRRNR